MIGVRLSHEMEAQLIHISQISKRSKSSILKEALANYLEDMEDYYLALERLEQHKKDGGKTVTLDDLAKELGIE